MNQHITLPGAVLIALFHPQIALADTSADPCATRPYVGVCQQGCDESAQPTVEFIAQKLNEEKTYMAQVNCDSNPYLGPLCGDSD
jgi:hypothetical protein